MAQYAVFADCEKGDAWTRQIGASNNLTEMTHLYDNYVAEEDTTLMRVRVWMTRDTVDENGNVTSRAFIKMRSYETSFDDEDDLE